MTPLPRPPRLAPWLNRTRLWSAPPTAQQARRIVLILPCCIGDVVLATATLKALRRGYPQAHITWAVGAWSRQAVEDHPLLDAVLDTGPDALPVRSTAGFRAFVAQLHAGQFDLAVSLVRSPLMSAAVWLAGVRFRAGLDSAGRGFGYNIRVRIDPHQRRPEGDIYLDVARALGLGTTDCFANLPLRPAHVSKIRGLVGRHGDYIVLNPAGGQNPGMTFDAKRWPPEWFAALGDRLADATGARLVVVGGPKDRPLVEALCDRLQHDALDYGGKFSFGEIAALAAGALAYIGNDTGLTHLAAAAGARTVMILGPTDPVRYAPFTPRALALWKVVDLPGGGVAAGVPSAWDWTRDGIDPETAFTQIMTFLNNVS